MSEFDYWDINTGEGVYDYELLERYDSTINEGGPVKIGYLEFMPSNILRELDPITYHVGFNDWVDSELGETLTEEEPEVEV